VEAREVEMSPIASNITGGRGRGEWEVVSFCFFEVVWGMWVEDVLYKYSSTAIVLFLKVAKNSLDKRLRTLFFAFQSSIQLALGKPLSRRIHSISDSSEQSPQYGPWWMLLRNQALEKKSWES